MQTYASCPARHQQTVTSRLLACVTDINNWLSSNRLKLNADETEFIWLGPRQRLVKLNVTLLLIKGQPITPSRPTKCKSLVSSLIDNELKMDDHVRNVVRPCFLTSKRPAITDYWCPSYFGICVHCQPGRLLQVSMQVTHRLQMVLNAAARLVVGRAGVTIFHQSCMCAPLTAGDAMNSFIVQLLGLF